MNVFTSDANPYRKFKLVPFDKGEETVLSVEKSLRNYDPTLRAMANAYIESNKVLHSRLPAKSRLKLLTATRSQFQQLMRKRQNGLISPPQIEQPQLKPTMQEMEPEPIVTTHKPIVTHKPNIAIPKRYAAKYENLLKLTSDTIGVGNHGEVVIHGQDIKNSSYSDVMRALYSESKGKSTIPGLTETIVELKRLQVPSHMITSPRARAIYQSVDQKGSGKYRSRPRVLRLY